MGPAERKDYARIRELLMRFDDARYTLPGIRPAGNLDSYVGQLLESKRRIKYLDVVQTRDISPQRADPASNLFDPHKGAVFLARQGQIDEAFWQVFISVHFGKNRKYGWRCARAVYGGLGTVTWDWTRICQDSLAFRQWLAKNQAAFRAGGKNGGFGNHRKYQSLKVTDPKGTAAAFETYVKWIGPEHSHEVFLKRAADEVGDDPKVLFAHLYRSMDAVASFGRMARFDYLTMVGKLKLADIAPDSPYLQDATGPLQGAKLMFLGNDKSKELSVRELEDRVRELGGALNVGMQEMEDSLCNWQKSPGAFVPFRG